MTPFVLNLEKIKKKFGHSKNYQIVEAKRRTIAIYKMKGSYSFDEMPLAETIERFSILMPRTLFVNLNSQLKCYALNDKDEICYQPLFNIDGSGAVCFGELSSDKYENRSMDEYVTLDYKVNRYYSAPFCFCFDYYAGALNQYFLNGRQENDGALFANFETVFNVKGETKNGIPKMKQNVRKFYQDHKDKNFNLIPYKQNTAVY